MKQSPLYQQLKRETILRAMPMAILDRYHPHLANQEKLISGHLKV
jgi:hypothetical protein